MPGKFFLTVSAVVIGGGAAWFSVDALDMSIPVALPLFPMALILAGLLKRPRRAPVTA